MSEIDVCPGCDSASLQTISSSSIEDRSQSGKDHVCTECGHKFNEPKTREKQGHSNGVGTLAAKLANANPDDL